MRIFVEKKDLLYLCREERDDLAEDSLDGRPGLVPSVNHDGEPRGLFRPGNNREKVLQKKMEVRLENLVETGIVRKVQQGVAGLRETAWKGKR